MSTKTDERTRVVTKAVEASIENVPDDKTKSDTGSFKVRLVVPGEDREGDDLQGKGWKLPLPDHIVFDTDHTMRVEKTVGSGKPTMLEDGSIEVEGDYAATDHAQLVRSLVPKHIKTVSVTLLERTTKAVGGGRRLVHRELLGGSFVPIPANPNAVVLMSKSVGGDAESDDADEAVEAHLAQNIHDDAVKLGASCSADGEPAGKGLTYSAAGGEGTYSRGRVATTVVTKAMSRKLTGSVEELSDRVRKAVRDTNRGNSQYAYVRATFLGDDSSGTVVYDLEDYSSAGGGVTKTLARDFTVDGSKVTLADTPREVSLVTTVVDEETPAGAVQGKSLDPLERALEYLVAGGMTREAASEQLGITHKSVILAPSEAATAATADSDRREAATQSAATEAAAPLDQRVSALLSSIDDAAG